MKKHKRKSVPKNRNWKISRKRKVLMKVKHVNVLLLLLGHGIHGSIVYHDTSTRCTKKVCVSVP